METQKIENLLDSSENEYPKFATTTTTTTTTKRKWYVVDSESKYVFSRGKQIKVFTSSLESSLCDYSDAYILVTGNIAVVGANNNKKVTFKNCASFRKCRDKRM